jgi:hypothetical protein
MHHRSPLKKRGKRKEERGKRKEERGKRCIVKIFSLLSPTNLYPLSFIICGNPKPIGRERPVQLIMFTYLAFLN